MKLTSSRAAAAALALAAVAAHGPALAQQQPESAAFVTTIGNDTIVVEKYTRTADRLTGEMVSRSPRTVQRSYTAELRPDGSVSRLEFTTRPLSGGPATRGTIVLGADSATTTVVRNDSTFTNTFAVSGPAIPTIGGSQALYEQAILFAQAAGNVSVDFAGVGAGARAATPVKLRPRERGVMELDPGSGPARYTMTRDGRVASVDGRGSTFQVTVERVDMVDLQGLASAFAARDAAGRGVGPLSPRDSAVADVGGAHVAVDYGRPFTRGRTIFGEVVPWGEVWRTGANAATGLRTTRDLVIRGVAVPAGAYTLWTIPSESGWKLIVNKKTGQWGTDYDQAQDLARIDMDVRALSTPVEQFTIAIDPTGNGGVLKLSWDTTEASVPFTVR